MKTKTAKILQRAGMMLALVMMFTMLAIPGFAAEDDSTSSSDPTPPPVSEPTGPLTVQSFLNKEGGAVTVTGYTVVDAAGNEIQNVKPGQKCRIIVGILDSRIKTPAGYPEEEIAAKKVELLTPAGESAFAANIKITSTESYASPSLGDIGTTTLYPDSITESGLSYSIILNDITYRGGKSELSLDLSYNKYGIPMTAVTQSISQCYEEKAPEGKPTTLVIPSASFGTNSVMAGSDFTLTVDVLASKGTVGADNVAVSLTLPEQFTSASGSTNVFIGSMAPGNSKQVTFQLTASAVANSGSYNITINVSGTSTSDSAALTATMPVTVPISQPERFDISRADIPEYLVEGEEGYGSAAFVNKGKGTIYNVSAEIVGEGIETEGSQFIGNVAPGTESGADFVIRTTQTGTLNVQLILTYENEKAEEKTLTKDFTITVEAAPMIEDPGMPMPFEPEPEQEGVSLWVWIVTGVGVVVVVVVVTLVILKKKKAKRRAAELLEDDDEDI